ncbi:MAG: hypothetical protein AAFQ98_25105 [Bacteroidota bacterium]
MHKLWLLLGVLSICLSGIAEHTLPEITQEAAEEYVHQSTQEAVRQKEVNKAPATRQPPVQEFLIQDGPAPSYYVPSVRRHVLYEQFLI